MRATRRHILDHPRVLLSAVLCLSVPAGAQEGGQSFGQTFVAWAKDQFQDAARSQAVTQVLGSSFGGSVNQAVDLYGGLKDIVTHGLTAIQQGMNGDLQAPERFFNQELPNDMLNLVLPGSLKDVVPNAQKLYDQMQQAGSDLV